MARGLFLVTVFALAVTNSTLSVKAEEKEKIVPDFSAEDRARGFAKHGYCRYFEKSGYAVGYNSKRGTVTKQKIAEPGTPCDVIGNDATWGPAIVVRAKIGNGKARLFAYSPDVDNWSSIDVGEDAYSIFERQQLYAIDGNKFHAFSAPRGRWDTIEMEGKLGVWNHYICLEGDGATALFSPEVGRWTVIEHPR